MTGSSPSVIQIHSWTPGFFKRKKTVIPKFWRRECRWEVFLHINIPYIWLIYFQMVSTHIKHLPVITHTHTDTHTHTHTHIYIYIYIYIYLFTNLISTSIYGIGKNKKKPGQEREIKVPWITAQGKKKKVFRVEKKEKANLVRLLEKNQGVRVQWSKENQKTLRECCNAIITKVLNTIQWSQL